MYAERDRIMLYGKAKYTSLVSNLLVKTRLADTRLNTLVVSLTSKTPIKIILLDTDVCEEQLFGKASYGNVIFIFIKNIVRQYSTIWKEVLLFTAVHEIVHLGQDTREYNREYKHLPMAKHRMECEADTMAQVYLKYATRDLEFKTVLNLWKFFIEFKPQINYDSTCGYIKFPIKDEFDSLCLDKLHDYLDYRGFKSFVSVNGLRLTLTEKSGRKERFYYDNIAFVFAYMELSSLMNKDTFIKTSKHVHSFTYEYNVYRHVSNLLA
jgi:hypothetical protein